MQNLPSHLPAPSAEALAHSAKLTTLLKQEIMATGPITFARFMELALYAPGLGYYSAGSLKFGQAGDFVTAPEVSPLFAACLAQQSQQVLTALPYGEILELGAGTGKLAVELLLELERLDSLPNRYLILEVSGDLRERQQALCQQKLPHLYDRLVWLEQLPKQTLNGVVIANEVLDAMDVHRFYLQKNKLQEFYVDWKDDQFSWQLSEPSSSELIEQVKQKIDWTANKGFAESLAGHSITYESEINLRLPAWIASIRQCLQQGLILLIDYGFPQQEFYHPDRHMGTLMCHYQHRAHSDPLILVGLQDITAHVDFTAVAESAINNGLQVAGFTTQAAFLLNCGLLDLVNTPSSVLRERLEVNQQVHMLTSPSEMGELFKVIGLAYGLEDLELI